MVVHQSTGPCDSYDRQILVIFLLVSVLALLGLLSLIRFIRFLLPRNVIPCVARTLAGTQQLLRRAEDINAIPHAEEVRACLEM
jgi:hypothetical protein